MTEAIWGALGVIVTAAAMYATNRYAARQSRQAVVETKVIDADVEIKRVDLAWFEEVTSGLRSDLNTARSDLNVAREEIKRQGSEIRAMHDQAEIQRQRLLEHSRWDWSAIAQARRSGVTLSDPPPLTA